jgi:hypothetical protein
MRLEAAIAAVVADAVFRKFLREVLLMGAPCCESGAMPSKS